MYIASLCTRYGSEIKRVGPKGKEKAKMYIFISKTETAEKLFSPSRFDGTNYLVKRCFKKKLNESTGKRELMYSGHSKVPVSMYTPIRFEFDHETDTVRINFYIQRYTEDGHIVDAAVQQLINQEMESDNMSLSD